MPPIMQVDGEKHHVHNLDDFQVFGRWYYYAPQNSINHNLEVIKVIMHDVTINPHN